jgi:hypothetical protein
MTKETILAVQEYFKQKLINGEFEIKEFSQYVIHIVIDKDFDFALWVSNGSDRLRTYEGEDSFMKLIFNEKEKKSVWKNLDKPLADFKNGDLHSQKLAAYENLRKELNLPS